MPETSIVIKVEDRYSSVVRSMSDVTKAFDKNAEHLERTLHDLSGEKSILQAETNKARKAMLDAQKQFAATGDEADALKASLAGQEYEDYRRKMEAINKTMKATEKQIQNVSGAAKSSSEAMKGGIGEVVSAFAASGIGNMVGDLAVSLSTATVGSKMGNEAGTIFSSALQSAASGAAIGSMIGNVAGIPGVAIGAVAGAGIGAVNGITQIFTEKDDAFKSYVQDAHEGQLAEQETSLTAGSTLAAGRETDRISFTQLFGNEQTADDYLSNMVDMANSTPFLYEDLKSMSKTLATYGFSAEETGEDDYSAILPTLQTIGDTGAALGQSVSDMTAVATALGRMKSSDKTTLEYLNILNDRGIGAVGMLAEAKGVSQGDMYTMISKGEIAGTEAAGIILSAMADSFQGAMRKQSQTYSGLSSTVEGLSQELDNAMGEGYNEERKRGLTDQRDWLSGDSGEAVMEANRAIGAWKADLENSKEQYIREAVDAMISSAEYQTAKEEGDAAEMGRLIMEAKVRGMNEYNASEGAQLALASEKALAEAIRDDTASNSDYWNAGYEKGQWFTKGLAAAIEPFPVTVTVDEQTGAVSYADKYDQSVDPMLVDAGGASGWAEGANNAFSKGGMSLPAFVGADRIEEEQEAKGDRGLSSVYKSWESPGFSKAPANASPSGLLKDWKPHAYGLDYVPYDEFPALLHQGERVLTAAEARNADRGGGNVQVTVSGNEFHVREDSDVDAIAEALAQRIKMGLLRSGE